MCVNAPDAIWGYSLSLFPGGATTVYRCGDNVEDDYVAYTDASQSHWRNLHLECKVSLIEVLDFITYLPYFREFTSVQ